jgi:hypothetical protein
MILSRLFWLALSVLIVLMIHVLIICRFLLVGLCLLLPVLSLMLLILPGATLIAIRLRALYHRVTLLQAVKNWNVISIPFNGIFRLLITNNTVKPEKIKEILKQRFS